MKNFPEQILNRGDHVNFLGNNQFNAINGTYIWWTIRHLAYYYVIEHPNGYPKNHFVSKLESMDGFESVPRKYLDDVKKYIYAQPEEVSLIEK